jgi:hypothetical protein
MPQPDGCFWTAKLASDTQIALISGDGTSNREPNNLSAWKLKTDAFDQAETGTVKRGAVRNVARKLPTCTCCSFNLFTCPYTFGVDDFSSSTSGQTFAYSLGTTASFDTGYSI